MSDVKWKDLYNFIQEEMKKDPKFLENKLMIELVSPEQCSEKSGWKTITDSEGWKYTTPAWKFGKTVSVLSTKFNKEKIVTLNINY